MGHFNNLETSPIVFKASLTFHLNLIVIGLIVFKRNSEALNFTTFLFVIKTSTFVFGFLPILSFFFYLKNSKINNFYIFFVVLNYSLKLLIKVSKKI